MKINDGSKVSLTRKYIMWKRKLIKRRNKKFKFSIIIPTYNNGDFLEKRSFKSLKKCENFDDIEIIIVDDGSSDIKTIQTIKRIQDEFENVKAKFFGENSKSPSKPRNEGIKLSTTKYISYLDPDNEVLDCAYNKLYEAIENTDSDLVIGNILIDKSNKREIRNYYNSFIKINNNKDESYNGREILINTNFKSQSIQSIMIKKEVILQKKIKMVEGAIGEDTLYFYELLLNCRKIKVINKIIHIYYKEEKESLTNRINSDFFTKYLLLEKEKKYKLTKYGLLDKYLQVRYEDYFRMWYLEKLKYVNKDQMEECIKIIKEIYKIYKNDWNIKDNYLKNMLNKDGVDIKNNMKFSIIIAVYNNGDFLKNRCIKSLRNLSMFDEIEIILVDDGSSDKETINTINELQKNYENIKTCFLKGPGSGSASRPRNKGLELSTTEYITYLDPDNEAVEDGYTVLYNAIVNIDIDLVVGNIIFTSRNGKSINDYYKVFTTGNNKSSQSNNSKDVLYKTEFMAQSIQATIIRKKIITENKLKMVDGAIGEDTLFFYELVNYSQKIMVVNECIHSYHTDTEGSTTNKIDANYFKKHLLVEKAKIQFLERNNLMDGYLMFKQDYNFRVWIFDKLNDVRKEEYTEAERIVNEIYNLYKDIWVTKDGVLIKYFSDKK